MQYNLGNYRYDEGKVYKRVWWFIFKKIQDCPQGYMAGVRIVNNLEWKDQNKQGE